MPTMHWGSEGNLQEPLEPAQRRRVRANVFSTMPAQPVDHSSLLSPSERLVALTSGQVDQGWLLQQDDPSVVTAGTTSWDRRALHATVFVVLVLVNANDTLLKSLSQQRGKALASERYLPSSVMFVSNLISVCIGNAVCIFKQQKQEDSVDMPLYRLRGLLKFWKGRQMVQMSLPALFFTLSGTLKFVALGLVSPDLVITVEQSTVLLCAFMGWAWLGKRYSALQVLMLLLVSCGFLWYQNAEHGALEASAADVPESLSHFWTGLTLMAGSVVMVTAGGLSCEKLLKASTDRPFYIQKAQMEFSMAVAGLFYCLVLQPLLQGSNPLLEKGLFYGWDGWTVIVLVFHTSKSWLATTTVRMLDNLSYTLAGNVAMLLVYLERLLFLSEEDSAGFQLEVFSGLCCMALGVVGFAVASARQHREVKQHRRRQRRNSSQKLSQELIDELRKPLLESRAGSKETRAGSKESRAASKEA